MAPCDLLYLLCRCSLRSFSAKCLLHPHPEHHLHPLLPTVSPLQGLPCVRTSGSQNCCSRIDDLLDLHHPGYFDVYVWFNCHWLLSHASRRVSSCLLQHILCVNYPSTHHPDICTLFDVSGLF